MPSLKNSRNYRIEIQFHTQESFDVKMSEEDHKLYEQRRVLEPGCDEYNRILQLQLKLYSDMEYPENIADLEKNLTESSGYSQSASLLAHNRITASQFIRRSLHSS